MPQLLFEVFTEELPVQAIITAKDFVQEYLAQEFMQKNLKHTEIITEASPRRIVVMIDELASQQEAITQEIYGPKLQAAYENDKPSKALLGFMNSKNLEQKDLYTAIIDNKEVVAAKVIIPSKQTKDFLPALLKEMLIKIPFIKKMRWCESKDSFARPIRGLVALFGNDYLPISFADVTSGDSTFGHRFLSEGKFKITSINQYLQELQNRFVILSTKKRKSIIIEESAKKCASINAFLIHDEDLLETVSNLCEYPFIILGSFDEKYLELPEQIIISEMKNHQKYFALKDKNNNLMPYFINVAATKPYSEEAFALGNATVLKARFEDGAFYFAQDKKIGLNQFAKKLDSLIFEKDLGSVAQKIERMQKVAEFLALELKLTNQEQKDLFLALSLSKADLLSGVVGEFPELQGIMGSIYASLQNENSFVCEAIEQHYWPKFATDNLPVSLIAAILSLVDKLDTLVGIIYKKGKPTGNKDPFALRRSAIAITRIMLEKNINIGLAKIIEISLKSYEQCDKNLCDDIESFIKQRARGILLEQYSKAEQTSCIDGVLDTKEDNLIKIFAKISALLDFKEKHNDDFISMLQTFKRASNIVKKAQNDGVDISCKLNKNLLSSTQEQVVLEQIISINNILETQKSIQSFADNKVFYGKLLQKIIELAPSLEAFFLAHMVMVDDDKLKEARLNMLYNIKVISENLADFTHI